MPSPYQPKKEPKHESQNIRGLDYHVTTWGDPRGEPLLLLHGWMDVGATFQFLADGLDDRWFLVAPDWRGCGQTGWAKGGYWFPDYMADLDALAEIYSPENGLNIVGHSMGGNVAGLYAGLRPDRVARLATLEGIGILAAIGRQAPERYRRWLDQIQVDDDFSPYESYEAFARYRKEKNPRIPVERVLFIARAWLEENSKGQVVPRGDPAHKRVNPVLYRRDEAEACWRLVEASVLLVLGEDSEMIEEIGGQSELERRQKCFKDITIARIPNAGHMMHHEQPEWLAGVLEKFFENKTGEK